MKNKVLSVFTSAFEKFTRDLSNEQIGELMKLLLAYTNGKHIPFINDKQVFYAYSMLYPNIDIICHTHRRTYMYLQSKILECNLKSM